MAWSRAFQKCIICHFLDKFFFANIFTIKLDFGIKNSIFANLQIFLQILKVEHKSFLMMYHLSYLDIKHGFREGGQIDPPFPSISWFSSTPAGIGLNISLIGVGQRIIIIIISWTLQQLLMAILRLRGSGDPTLFLSCLGYFCLNGLYGLGWVGSPVKV